jgi:transcriptional regulator with XRE-family HTH domain
VSNNKFATEEAKKLRKQAGIYLRGLRVDAGLSQAQVAKAIGWEYFTMVSQVERGLTRVPPELLGKYAGVVQADRQEFTKTLLKLYDPHVYKALFGGQN